MLSQITRFVKNILSRFTGAANRLFRRITHSASANMVTGTLADLQRSAHSEKLLSKRQEPVEPAVATRSTLQPARPGFSVIPLVGRYYRILWMSMQR